MRRGTFWSPAPPGTVTVVGLPRPDEKSLAGTRCTAALLDLGVDPLPRDQILSVEAGEDGAGDHGVAVGRVVAVVVEELRACWCQPRARVVGLFRLPVGAQRRQGIKVRDAAPGAELAAAILRIVVLIAAQHLDVHGEEQDRKLAALLAGLLPQGGHDAVQDLPGPG